MQKLTKSWSVHNKKRYLLSAFLVTFSLTFISLRESDELPGDLFPHIDKVFHIVAYFVLTILWSAYLFLQKPKWKSITIQLIVTLGLFVYGIIIEILQSRLTTSRMFEIYDLLANMFGMILGAFLFMQIVEPKLKNN